MTRVLFACAAAVSALLCAAAVALWVRNPTPGEFFGTETVVVSASRAFREQRGAWSGGGRLMLGIFTVDSANPANVQVLSTLPPARGELRHLRFAEPLPRWGPGGPPRWESLPVRLGFYANRYRWTGPTEFGGYTYLTVPHWFAAAVTGAPAGAWLAWQGSHLRRRLRARAAARRLARGRCEHCGYDLTGNASGTCPECGARAAPPPSRHPPAAAAPRA